MLTECDLYLWTALNFCAKFKPLSLYTRENIKVIICVSFKVRGVLKVSYPV